MRKIEAIREPSWLNSGTMRSEPPQDDLTDDAALGGRLRLWQPRRGHRFGHDAILLAAATAAQEGDIAVDLGAGVGTAGLALALRVPGVRVRLADVDPRLSELAAENARRNGLADRVTAVTLDVDANANTYAAACLGGGNFDVVLMNPPFNDPDSLPPSPEPGRRLAHSQSRAGLSSFLSAAARLLRVDGILTMIYRADAVDMLLSLLHGGFGAATLMPVHPKPDTAAIRVIVRAVRASRAPPAILPGLVLAQANGRPSEAAKAVLRESAALPLAQIGTPRRRAPRTRPQKGD